MMRRILVTAPILLALFLTACPQKDDSAAKPDTKAAPAKEGTPLVTFGEDGMITLEEFKGSLDKQSAFLRARYTTLERKKEFLDNMIRFELLAREAQRRGLDQDPEVQETMKKVMVQKLVRAQFEEGANSELDDAALRAFYQEHIQDYVKPERLRASHVFVAVASVDAKAQARKTAEKLLAEVKAGAKDPTAFQRVAREKSEDVASREVGGDLGYRSKEELATAWGQALADAAFGLQKVGDMSAIVEGDKGFHILKMTGRQKALDRSFDQVRRNIEQRLKQDERRKNYDDFLAGLRENEGVKVDEALLDKVDVSTSGVDAAAHMALPGAARPVAKPAADDHEEGPAQE